jgi:hypothetical protein
MMRHILMDGIVLAAAAGIVAWWITKWSVRAWAVATASPLSRAGLHNRWQYARLFGWRMRS